jgi:hypothetical protein
MQEPPAAVQLTARVFGAKKDTTAKSSMTEKMKNNSFLIDKTLYTKGNKFGKECQELFKIHLA